MKKTTDELMKLLSSKPNTTDFIEEYNDELLKETLPQHLSHLLEQSQKSKASVIADANLDRTYGYQIFDGRKNPSRDKLLQLAFGLDLTVAQTQTMLKIAQEQQLYPRVKRDTYILSSLFKRKSLTDCNCTLAENHLAVLGELK